jgi:hypothetical protein
MGGQGHRVREVAAAQAVAEGLGGVAVPTRSGHPGQITPGAAFWLQEIARYRLDPVAMEVRRVVDGDGEVDRDMQVRLAPLDHHL